MQYKIYLLFIFFGISISAQQQVVLGSVIDENGQKIKNALIFNTSTDEKAYSDNSGNFILNAKEKDLLRIIKTGFEIRLISVTNADTHKPMQITIIKLPLDIEEVKITFQPSGNLKKDVLALAPSAKVTQLNSDIRGYVRRPPAEPLPKASIPSAFQPHDFSAGQVSLLGLADGIIKMGKAIFGKSEPSLPLNITEKQVFYKRIRDEIDLNFFYKYGFDDYDFDRFLAYQDQNLGLSKKYGRNFDINAIQALLKSQVKEYLKNHQVNG